MNLRYFIIKFRIVDVFIFIKQFMVAFLNNIHGVIVKKKVISFQVDDVVFFKKRFVTCQKLR